MNNNQNKPYESPEITLIKLDLEISLQMASDVNPMEEPEWANKVQDHFTNDPYQST